MTHSRTTLELYSQRTAAHSAEPRRSVISLHSHSAHSREKLVFIPEIARQIPLVARRFDRSMANYERVHGRALDFSATYWRPPLAPAAVVRSEREQAVRRFDLPALVSLTDHDSLEGPRALRRQGDLSMPLSFEWSLPFMGSMFHLGLHAIAPSHVEEMETALAAVSARGVGPVADLLEALSESQETVVVLNHPYWDLAGVGQRRHDANLLTFLRAHSDWIHGLELNGYRTWTENRRVLPLAEGFGIPIVAGGDRHGYVPNALVNLSRATSFAEFAHELREERVSHCVLMPEYEAPFFSRVLETACDILRPDPRGEGRPWQDRVFTSDGGVERPLNASWAGTPSWVQACVAIVRALGSTAARPLFALTRADGYRALKTDCQPVSVSSGQRQAPRPSVAA